MDFLFVASCNGLDSLSAIEDYPKGIPTNVIEMMCNANMHIGQMYGIVEIQNREVANELKKMDPEVALNLIKEAKYSFPKGKVEQFKRIWNKIPNKQLSLFN